MPEAEPKRNVLLYLAAEGIVPVLGGCAGAMAGGPMGGVAGVAVGHAVERAINLFGKGIVERWRAWFAAHPQEANAAVVELAAVPVAEARAEARDILLELAPDVEEGDLALAVEFLTAIPRSANRALVPDANGTRSLPPTVSLDDPRSLLQLLPEDLPPYPVPSDLPGTPYRLVELLGAGGFGAVYRAVSPTLQHLPLAIKFCLDRSLLPALNQERSNLERLMRAGGHGSDHVVRLYGYDLDHPTPYLVYEYVPGGDLTHLLAARRAILDRPPSTAEVLGWVVQVAEGLAFAHRSGLVHRDLKPANVLVEGARGQGGGAGPDSSPLTPCPSSLAPLLKLADFGLGGVAATRAAVRSRIGASTLDYLSLADQASLFRGAGTPLYMCPEQRRGASPDPRHDLYALGVVWFQLLAGDVSRELHPGWARELKTRFGTPTEHIALIERCVGWYDERPKDANELLALLRDAADLPLAQPATELPAVARPPAPAPDTAVNASQLTPTPQATGLRRSLLVSMVEQLADPLDRATELEQRNLKKALAWGFLLAAAAGWFAGEFAYAQRHAELRSYPNAFGPGPFDGRAVMFGILVGLLTWIAIPTGIWLVNRTRRETARRYAAARADTLANEFPSEVAAWGGRSVLGNADLVNRIQSELTTSIEPVPADPAARRVRLESLLRKLDTAHDWSAQLQQWGPGITVAFGLVIGLFVGWMAGEFVYSVRHPEYTFPKLLRPADGPNDWVANLAGFGVGLVVWLGYVAVVREMVGDLRQLARKNTEDIVSQVAGQFPAEAAGWGGRVVLHDPVAVRKLLTSFIVPETAPPPESGPDAPHPAPQAASGLRKPLLVSMVTKLDDAHAAHRLAEQVGPWLHGVVVVIGLTAAWLAAEVFHAFPQEDVRFPSVFSSPVDWGAVVGGGVVSLLFVWLPLAAGVHTWLDRRRARPGSLADKLANEFPAEVAAWGGRAVLDDPGLVARVRDELGPPKPPTREPVTTASGLPPASEWVGPLREVLADPVQKAVFLTQLRDLEKTVRTTAKNIADCGAMGVIFPAVFGGGGGLAIALGTTVSGAWPVYVGVPVAVVAGAAVAVMFRLIFQAAIRTQRARGVQAVRAFMAANPAMAARCGEMSLRTPTFLRSLLQVVDDSPRPGLWGRVLGE